MKSVLFSIITAAATAAAIALSPPAHADDASYLDALHRAGIQLAAVDAEQRSLTHELRNGLGG